MSAWVMLWFMIGVAAPARHPAWPEAPLDDPAVRAKLYGPIEYGDGELSRERSCGMHPTQWVRWLRTYEGQYVLVTQDRSACGDTAGSIRLELYDVSGERARMVSASELYEDVAYGRADHCTTSTFATCNEIVLLLNGRSSDIERRIVLRVFNHDIREEVFYFEECSVEEIPLRAAAYLPYVFIIDYAESYLSVYLFLNRYNSALIEVTRRLHSLLLFERITNTRMGSIYCEFSYARGPICTRWPALWVAKVIDFSIHNFTREPWLLDRHKLLAMRQLAALLHQHELISFYRARLILWSLWMTLPHHSAPWRSELTQLALELLLWREPSATLE